MNKKTPSCYLCGHKDTYDFFEMPPVPTMDGVMCPDLESAIAVQKGKIRLRFCHHCGFIGNESYDGAKVKFDSYDFTNDHSPLFRDYVQSLCHELIRRFDLQGKTLLDVGCGDGYFLRKMCSLTGGKGIGIDPGFDHSKRKAHEGLQLEYIQDYYSDKYRYLHPDLVSCRLVIDLLPDPVSFLRIFRNNLEGKPETVIFFEVPDGKYTFDQQVIYNVVYEHRSWFTEISFRYLFESCGFEVIEVFPLWNQEFLGITARIDTRENAGKGKYRSAVNGERDMVVQFSKNYETLLEIGQCRIRDLRQTSSRVLAWGAGARAVSFFNLFDIKELVPYVVDINVNRQGKFIPGSGQGIVAPEFALAYEPELIIITNPTYAREIQQQVEAMGLTPKYWVL